MQNNPLLSAGKTVEIIARLRDSITEFAGRERKVTNGYRINSANLRETRDQTTEQNAAQLETEIEAITLAYQAKREEVEASYHARSAEIEGAHRSAKQGQAEQVRSTTGQGQYDRQKHVLLANRTRDAAVLLAKEAFQSVKETVAEEKKDLKELEKTARSAFRGYPKFTRQLAKSLKSEEPLADAPDDDQQLLADLRKSLDAASSEIGEFRGFGAPRFFRIVPASLILVFVILAHIAVVPWFMQKDYALIPYVVAAGSMILLMGIVIFIHARGMRVSEPSAMLAAEKLGRARKLATACVKGHEARHERELAAIEEEHEKKIAEFETNYRSKLRDASAIRGEAPEIDSGKRQAQIENKARYDTELAVIKPGQQAEIDRTQLEAETRQKMIENEFETGMAVLESRTKTNWEKLVVDWTFGMAEIKATLDASASAAAELFPPWTEDYCKNWTPATEFQNAAQFARLDVDLDQLVESHPEDERLVLPFPRQFSAPLMLRVPAESSLLIETKNSGRQAAIDTLNNAIMRILSVVPPGRASFTVLDPVGLGESFAGVMHLADFEEHVIHSKIWTQSSQIDSRLTELNEHMEKVIQMYLRNEYETIFEYNQQAGNIAEKYHYLVVADFPNGFSDMAAKRLMSIAASGARCGVYTLLHWDTRQDNLPNDFVPQDLRAASVCLSSKADGDLKLAEGFTEGVELVVEKPPKPEWSAEFVQRVGQASIDSSRVEVPFEHVAPPGEFWTESSEKELRVPVGRTGATKLQYMAIGKGTRQHALLAGKTGSGKSTLFHVMITNLALWFSPDEVEFYLIDFKKGVEFKCYGSKRLPHARVVAIESDREFGLSVLQRVDEELKRRGDMFRKVGAQDIAGYKRAGGTEPVPRCLLLIDEFQEFFTEDDRVSQNAAVLMDRIVRQGRAFGIHAILGSQTLGGAFTLARTTLGQMVIRIALQCNEADSYLIMDDSNPAARLLTRPGEGIYNDSAGALEGNSPFQVVWLDEAVRDRYLDQITELAAKSDRYWPPPVVFEGNAPADIRENGPLEQLLAGKAAPTPGATRVWIGAPNSIKGPTELIFVRQAGANVLVVGQRDEAVLSILALSLIALSGQHAKDGARFVVFDGTAPGSPERDFLHGVAEVIPQGVTLAHPGDAEKVMVELDTERKRRAEDASSDTAPPVYVFVHGLQKYKKLRHEDDFGFSLDDDAPANPGALFNDLITDGATVGMHVIVFCDTYNNIGRALNRKALTEFEMRVLFQMSANDSASLIDSQKASTLGLNRALFYNEQEGYLETFRPYAMPDKTWITEAGQQLAKLAGG